MTLKNYSYVLLFALAFSLAAPLVCAPKKPSVRETIAQVLKNAKESLQIVAHQSKQKFNNTVQKLGLNQHDLIQGAVLGSALLGASFLTSDQKMKWTLRVLATAPMLIGIFAPKKLVTELSHLEIENKVLCTNHACKGVCSECRVTKAYLAALPLGLLYYGISWLFSPRTTTPPDEPAEGQNPQIVPQPNPLNQHEVNPLDRQRSKPVMSSSGRIAALDQEQRYLLGRLKLLHGHRRHASTPAIPTPREGQANQRNQRNTPHIPNVMIPVPYKDPSGYTDNEESSSEEETNSMQESSQSLSFSAQPVQEETGYGPLLDNIGNAVVNTVSSAFSKVFGGTENTPEQPKVASGNTAPLVMEEVPVRDYDHLFAASNSEAQDGRAQEEVSKPVHKATVIEASEELKQAAEEFADQKATGIIESQEEYKGWAAVTSIAKGILRMVGPEPTPEQKEIEAYLEPLTPKQRDLMERALSLSNEFKDEETESSSDEAMPAPRDEAREDKKEEQGQEEKVVITYAPNNSEQINEAAQEEIIEEKEVMAEEVIQKNDPPKVDAPAATPPAKDKQEEETDEASAQQEATPAIEQKSSAQNNGGWFSWPWGSNDESDSEHEKFADYGF